MCCEWMAASGQNYNKAGISQRTRSIFKALAFAKTLAVCEADIRKAALDAT